MRRAWRGEGPALDRHSAEASGKTARLACGEWEVAPRPPAATSCSPGAPPHPPAQNRRCHGHTGSHLGTAEAAGGGGGEASGARLGAAGGDPVRAPGRVCGPTQHRVSLLGAGGEPLWDTAMREEGGTRAAPGTRKSQTSEQVRPKQKRKSNNMNMDKTPEHRHDKTLPCEHAAHTHTHTVRETPTGGQPRCPLSLGLPGQIRARAPGPSRSLEAASLPGRPPPRSYACSPGRSNCSFAFPVLTSRLDLLL